ncbi:MAG: hypothetical protein ACI8VT_003864, partial [Saprospiraceae bacterium]
RDRLPAAIVGFRFGIVLEFGLFSFYFRGDPDFSFW